MDKQNKKSWDNPTPHNEEARQAKVNSDLQRLEKRKENALVIQDSSPLPNRKFKLHETVNTQYGWGRIQKIKKGKIKEKEEEKETVWFGVNVMGAFYWIDKNVLIYANMDYKPQSMRANVYTKTEMLFKLQKLVNKFGIEGLISESEYKKPYAAHYKFRKSKDKKKETYVLIIEKIYGGHLICNS
jgi:hypothetical protein